MHVAEITIIITDIYNRIYLKKLQKLFVCDG